MLAPRRLIAEIPHTYTNADGTTHAIKPRLIYRDSSSPTGERKEIKGIFRPDGNGGLIPGAPPGRHPIYALPAIRSADDDATVYVMESEKVCDDLAGADFNLLATTALTMWKNTDPEPLRGRHLVYLVDNDPDGKGEKNLIDSAEILAPIAASFRAVRTNGEADTDNLGDKLIKRKIKLHEFERICSEAPEYEPQANQQQNGEDIALEWECMDDVESEEVDWLWLNRLARGKLTLLCGDPDLGKSQITLDICKR